MALPMEPRSPFFCLSIYLLIYPSIFFQRYLNLYVMNHSIMTHHVCLFPSSLLCFRRVKPLPRFLPTLPFSPNFSIVITLFPDLLSLSQSIYQSCLFPTTFPSFFIFYIFLSHPPSSPSAANNEANALRLSSQCSYNSTSCCSAPHFHSFLFLSSTLPPFFPSFPLSCTIQLAFFFNLNHVAPQEWKPLLRQYS